MTAGDNLAKQQKRKISQSDFSDRIIALQSLYGKQTAQKLGISQSSLNRYLRGQSVPKQENYDKINKAYNRVKKQVTPEKFQQTKQRRQKKQAVYSASERHMSAFDYANYIYNKYGQYDIDNIDRLIEIGEHGYEVAYLGNNKDTVQYIIHGTSLKDTENYDGFLNVILLYGKSGRGGKKSAGYMTKEIVIKGIPGIVAKNENIDAHHTFSENMASINAYFDKYQNQYSNGKSFVYAVLGFYFKE